MTIDTPASLLGVVLCGGKSSRMGHDKSQILDSSGRTYLDIAADRLAKIVEKVVLCGSPKQETNLIVLADTVADQGPITGIVSALQFASQNGFAGCLVTPVDTPFLAASNLQSLIDRWCETGVPTFANSDRLQPLIGIYPVGMLIELKLLSQSGDRSLFRWLSSQSTELVDLPETVCRNINTPEDLNR